MTKTYHLYLEHIKPKISEKVGDIYEVSFTLAGDIEEIYSFGGLKPFLDHHWNIIPIGKQCKMIGCLPLTGSLKILAVKKTN